MYGDGNTLYVNVTPRGTKSWIQRVVVHGRRRDIGLGSCARVPLARARALAAANLVTIAAGGDPLVDRKCAHAPTFRDAARAALDGLRPRWRDATRAAAVWWRSMERHVLPAIGDLPVNAIHREHVLGILTPIRESRPAAARKVRQRIRTVLAWALAHGHVEANMAGEVIDGALPAAPAERPARRSVPYRDVPAILAAVAESGAGTAARQCFRFMVLTAAGPGETRGARWADIDQAAREWRIPRQRTTSGVEHVVPLTDGALRVIEAAAEHRKGFGLVFPSPARPGQPLSDNTLSKLLRDLGVDAVPRGFRAAFRTWAEETADTPYAALQLTLGQAAGQAGERPGVSPELRRKQRALMERWSAFVEGGEARD